MTFLTTLGMIFQIVTAMVAVGGVYTAGYYFIPKLSDKKLQRLALMGWRVWSFGMNALLMLAFICVCDRYAPNVRWVPPDTYAGIMTAVGLVIFLAGYAFDIKTIQKRIDFQNKTSQDREKVLDT